MENQQDIRTDREAYLFTNGRMPLPGDVVEFRAPIRAWEEANRRGINGRKISTGEVGFVVQTWLVGNQVRNRIMIGTELCIVSCHMANVHITINVRSR